MLTDTTHSNARTFSGWAMRRLPMMAFLLVASFGLTGCYTQLAVMERPHGDLDQVVADYGDDGDILVRRYYEDGYVEEEVYNEYDWYYHRPYSYARYFDSFYGPAYGVTSHCWDIFYCDPYWGYGSGFSLTLGWGSYGYWGRPYSSFGFGWGYDPFYWGSSYYRPYSHYPTWAYYGGGYGYRGYSYGSVRAATGHYAPRGETMARSALTSRTRGTRGGRDLNGVAGTRSGLSGRGVAGDTRTVVSTGRGSTATSKGLATGTRPSRGTLTSDRSTRTTVGSTRTTTRSNVGSTRTTTRSGVGTTRTTTRSSGWDRSATRTTGSSVGTRTTRSSSGSRATTRTSGNTGSRAVPTRSTSRTGSSVGRSTNSRSGSSTVRRSTGSSSRSSGVRSSSGSSSRSSGVSRSSGSSSRSSGVSRSSGSSSRSSGVSRSSGSSSRSSGVSRSSGSSSSRSSGRSSSRSKRNN